MSSPRLSFKPPGLATAESPVFISSSHVFEILSPRPIRRVSMVSVMHLAGIMEASVVPPPPPPRATTTTTIRRRPVPNKVKSDLPPPPTRATTITTIRRRPVPNRGKTDLLSGSEPAYDNGARFGVIGGERRVKTIGVIGGEWGRKWESQ
ncbi:hypothetical protein ACEPPN_009457 [Leptodophora sp. 'Broadleaf-Isolate-01']